MLNFKSILSKFRSKNSKTKIALENIENIEKEINDYKEYLEKNSQASSQDLIKEKNDINKAIDSSIEKLNSLKKDSKSNAELIANLTEIEKVIKGYKDCIKTVSKMIDECNDSPRATAGSAVKSKENYKKEIIKIEKLMREKQKELTEVLSGKSL